MHKVVIAGGGTAGWMAAATLAKLFKGRLAVTLVESDEIATVGVGEATVAKIKILHHELGFNEQEFMNSVQATFKLGISFENWRDIGANYWHVFGEAGRGSLAADFHHYWLKGRSLGVASDLAEYCNESLAASQNRFGLSLKSGLGYAYHLDASLYAQFLRKFAESLGTVRREGRIQQVEQDPFTGYITKLQLQSGEYIEGDLFLDCTGFRGLLIDQTLQIGFEDYDRWLPCDRAIAVQTEAVLQPVPYTRAIAHECGWQWQIPLQHRVGNGVVYSSNHWSDDEAQAHLVANIQGALITEPRLIRFRAGQRSAHWHKNCVAIGLASGFIEPLESTSIHLIMQSLIRLAKLIPSDKIRPPEIAEFNAQMQAEINSIRDFIILHYKVTQRTDSDFWQHCRAMDVPASLTHRIGLFHKSGRVIRRSPEMFDETSWIQVMLGQGLTPQQYHPVVDTLSESDLQDFLNEIVDEVDYTVKGFPKHYQFLDDYCNVSD